jgi:hypothetical protein
VNATPDGQSERAHGPCATGPDDNPEACGHLPYTPEQRWEMFGALYAAGYGYHHIADFAGISHAEARTVLMSNGREWTGYESGVDLAGGGGEGRAVSGHNHREDCPL